MCFGRIILPIETNGSTIGTHNVTITQLYTKEKLSDLYKDIPIAILFWSYYFTH